MKTYRLKEGGVAPGDAADSGCGLGKGDRAGEEVWLDTAGNPSGCVCDRETVRPVPFRGRGGAFPSERRTFCGESRRASLSPHPEGNTGNSAYCYARRLE